MENQHRQIKGYKKLDQQQIDMMSSIKSVGKEIGEMLDTLEATGKLNERWLAGSLLQRRIYKKVSWPLRAPSRNRTFFNAQRTDSNYLP